MVNTNVPRGSAASELLSGAVCVSLVNHGQDTKLIFRDGSTIVLKGVSRLDTVLPAEPSSAAPVGGEIGDDGERAHHRRHGGERLRRVRE